MNVFLEQLNKDIEIIKSRMHDVFKQVVLFNVFKKKYLFLIISLSLLASSLSSFSLGVILGLIDSSSGYLGGGENVLVIYNEKARTPYTGRVPLYLEENLKKLDGVLEVSPEVITPTMVEKEIVMCRGADLSKFLNFQDLSLDVGDYWSKQDYNAPVAIAGASLANRLKLSVGSTIRVHSTMVDFNVKIRIVGIFSSQNSLLNDELLIPLQLAQKFAYDAFNHVTLFQVRYDPNVISKENLLKIVKEDHLLTVRLWKYNSTEVPLGATLLLQDLNGKIIKKIYLKNTNVYTFNLKFNTYFVSALIDGVWSKQVKIFLTSDVELDYYGGPIFYKTLFVTRMDKDLKPLGNVTIKIYRSDADGYSKVFVDEVITNSSGIATITLQKRYYWFKAEILGTEIQYHAGLSRVHYFDFWSEDPTPTILSPEPKVGNTRVKIVVQPHREAINTTYFIEGIDTENITLEGIDERNLTQGVYTLHVYSWNLLGHVGSTSRTFQILLDPPILDSVTPANHSVILPGENISFESDEWNGTLTWQWDDGEILRGSAGDITAPLDSGRHVLNVTLHGYSGEHSSYTLYYFVDGVAPFISLKNVSNNSLILSGSQLETYILDSNGSIQYQWDDEVAVKIPANSSIPVPTLPGRWTLRITSWDELGNENELIFLFTILDTVPVLKTETPVNGSTVSPGEVIHLDVESTTTLYYSWDSMQNITLSSNFHVVAPDGDGQHILRLWLKNPFSSWIEYVLTYTVQGTSESTPPSIYILSPGNETITTNTISINLAGSATSYKYFILGVDDENITWTGEVSRTLLDGTYTLIAFGEKNGLTSKINVSFTIVTNPPSLELLNWQVNLTASFLELNVQSTSNMLLVNIPGIIDENVSLPVNSVLYLPAGTWTLNIFAITSWGFETKLTKTINVEWNFPYIQILDPPRELLGNSFNLTVHTNATEVNITITNEQGIVVEQIVRAGGNFTEPITLEDGHYIIRVLARTSTGTTRLLQKKIILYAELHRIIIEIYNGTTNETVIPTRMKIYSPKLGLIYTPVQEGDHFLVDVYKADLNVTAGKGARDGTVYLMVDESTTIVRVPLGKIKAFIRVIDEFNNQPISGSLLYFYQSIEFKYLMKTNSSGIATVKLYPGSYTVIVNSYYKNSSTTITLDHYGEYTLYSHSKPVTIEVYLRYTNGSIVSAPSEDYTPKVVVENKWETRTRLVDIIGKAKFYGISRGWINISAWIYAPGKKPEIYNISYYLQDDDVIYVYIDSVMKQASIDTTALIDKSIRYDVSFGSGAELLLGSLEGGISVFLVVIMIVLSITVSVLLFFLHVSLGNLLSEISRELKLLKILGTRDWQIIASVTWQVLSWSLIGSIFGFLMAWGTITLLLANNLFTIGGYTYHYKVNFALFFMVISFISLIEFSLLVPMLKKKLSKLKLTKIIEV